MIRGSRDSFDIRVSAVQEAFSLFWDPRITRTTSNVIPTITNTITIALVPIPFPTDSPTDLLPLMKIKRQEKMWSNRKYVTFSAEKLDSLFGNYGEKGRAIIRRNFKTSENITAISSHNTYGENVSNSRYEL